MSSTKLEIAGCRGESLYPPAKIREHTCVKSKGVNPLGGVQVHEVWQMDFKGEVERGQVGLVKPLSGGTL